MDNYTNEYLYEPVCFQKRNGIVTVQYFGDWKPGVPGGEIGTLLYFDQKYAPKVPGIVTMVHPYEKIQITVVNGGVLRAYNYGAALTVATPGRFSMSYLAAN